MCPTEITSPQTTLAGGTCFGRPVDCLFPFPINDVGIHYLRPNCQRQDIQLLRRIRPAYAELLTCVNDQMVETPEFAHIVRAGLNRLYEEGH